MVRLRLMCGLAGAGKSTYARSLEERGWLRLSIDHEAWAMGLVEIPFPTSVTDDIRARHQRRIAEALRAGQDVVVDYSFWARAQRDEYRALGRACGAVVDVAYVDVPEAELRRRLAERRRRDPDDFPVSDDLLTAYISGFEAPGSDETDVTTVSSPD